MSLFHWLYCFIEIYYCGQALALHTSGNLSQSVLYPETLTNFCQRVVCIRYNKLQSKTPNQLDGVSLMRMTRKRGVVIWGGGGILYYDYFGWTVRIWPWNMAQGGGGLISGIFIAWLLWMDGKDLATERGTEGGTYKRDFKVRLLWMDGKDLATEYGTRGDL